MFDFIFGSMMAFQTLGMFLISIVFMGVGTLFAGDFLHWRFGAQRIKGKIITFSENKGGTQPFYYPVVEYTDHNGNLQKMTTGMGSSDLDEKKVGKVVTLLYFPHKNKEPRILGGGIPFLLFGLLFLGAGLFVLYQAVQVFELNWYLAVAVLGICGYIWSKSQGVKIPIGYSKNNSKHNAKNLISDIKDQVSEQRKTGQKELTPQEIRDISIKTGQQQARWSWLMALIGLVCIGIGGYVGYGVWFLETHGVSVEGKVTGIETNTDSDGGTTYSPVVTFQTLQDRKITFTSNYGSNPPSYKVGDQVDVLYDPNDPKDNAMIDAGLWNWLLPSILALVGGFMFLILFPKMLMAGNRAR